MINLAAMFLVASAVCALLFLYPYLGYPLFLRLLSDKAVLRGAPSAGQGEDFALLFCAYNEAGALPEKLENLRALLARYPHLQILIYDDNSTDGTHKLLEECGLPLEIVKGAGRTGKAHGMKMLVAKSRAKYLVFTDANVLVDGEVFDELAASYADRSVGGVCGRLLYGAADQSSTEAVGGAYWRLEEHIKYEESRSGNVMGADGSIFSVRRELYPEFSDTVQDDFTVSMSVVFQGYRLIQNELVVAREELVSLRKLELERKIRIATRAFHTHMSHRSNLHTLNSRDRWCYWSHKTLRWMGGFILPTGALFFLIGLALVSPVAAVVCAVLLALGLSLGARQVSGPLAAAFEILSSIICTSMGVVRALRGVTMATWSPPRPPSDVAQT